MNKGVKFYTIHVCVNMSKVRRRIRYYLVAWCQSGKLLCIWAAAEERMTDKEMEDANAIKLPIMLAKDKG